MDVNIEICAATSFAVNSSATILSLAASVMIMSSIVEKKIGSDDSKKN